MAAPLSSEAELRSIIPDAAFKRGKELFIADKLHDVEFQGELIDRVNAICGGSNPGDSYDVSIIVDPNASEKPICTCTCPGGRGKMCKHSVALLLLRAKKLNNGASGSGSGNDDEMDAVMNEEEEDDVQHVEWVSNPEKIVPDPHARRLLPKWMTEAPPAKVKTGRPSKKLKVEDEDGEEKPAKNAPAKRKSKDEADKPVSRKKALPKAQDEEAAPSRTRKTRTPEEAEDGNARSRGRSKRPRDEEEQSVAKPTQNRRKLQKQTEESTSEVDGMDLTSDDLLSIAQQHLESPSATPDPEPEPATAAPEAEAKDTQPMESQQLKRRKDDSIFSTSLWKKSMGVSGNALSQDNGASFSVQREQQLPIPPPPAEMTTADSLASDMFGLMFGPNFAKAAAAAAAVTAPAPNPAFISNDKAQKPVEQRTGSPPMGVERINTVSTAAERPVVGLESCRNRNSSSGFGIGSSTSSSTSSSSIQPKPKKKSSLKDQIGTLLT